MRKFEQIYETAAKRKGGKSKLDCLLKAPVSANVLANTDDSRYLAQLTRCVFNAGFIGELLLQNGLVLRKLFTVLILVFY